MMQAVVVAGVLILQLVLAVAGVVVVEKAVCHWLQQQIEVCSTLVASI
jgi:hypothetical protein